MLRTQFKDQAELDIYITEQKDRKIKGYLTKSEREQLERMIKNSNEFIKKETNLIHKTFFPIVEDINELRKPCQEVTENNDEIKMIIKRLKDTLENRGGVGISANQIGYNKRISILKVPIFKDKKMEFIEYTIINAQIDEKAKLVKINDESCLSFPKIYVDTQRYVYCVITYMNEKMELQTKPLQDLESLIAQHEIDHQNGLTIFQRRVIAR